MRLQLSYPLVLLLLLRCAGVAQTLHDGDIIFIRNKDVKSQMLLPAGNNIYNYLGIVFIENDTAMVYHAKQPLSKCAFNDFLELSENREFAKRALADKKTLTREARAVMHDIAVSELGSAYDNDLRLGNTLFYNAEFVWMIYDTGLHLPLCIPREAKDYAKGNATWLELLTESYGEAFLSEKIITVGDIFQSQFLE